MWKLKIRHKVKYFLWISLSNKIITWENFQKRTWKDTRILFLCKNNSEDVSHMLISCQISQIVWAATLPFSHIFKKLDGMIWNEISSTHTCSSILGSVKFHKRVHFLGGIPIPSQVFCMVKILLSWNENTSQNFETKNSVETQHWQVRLGVFLMVIIKECYSRFYHTWWITLLWPSFSLYRLFIPHGPFLYLWCFQYHP